MSEFEFTKEQNQTFKELSTRMYHFAIALGLLGVLLIGLGISRWANGINFTPISIALMVVGGIIIGIAYFFTRPLDNIENIITTEGRDITELMVAIDDLDQSYNLLRLFLIVVNLFLILGMFYRLTLY